MFHLTRYYSLASIIGIGVIAVALSMYFRHVAVDILVTQQTQANVDLTRSYSNALWDEFAELVERSDVWSPEELREHPEVTRLRELTAAHMAGTNVAKIKVYNLRGMTVFSTEAAQIGEDKHDNLGFQAARSGEPASELTFRGEFYTFEQVVLDRDLVATYLPIRDEADDSVRAVFEVYSDVTPLVDKMQRAVIMTVSGITVALIGLYLFLLLIVQRADRILRLQEDERQQNEARIRHQALHDSLTGLANRHSFAPRMKEAIQRAIRQGKSGALLFIDLDRFKQVNDLLGHDAGDQLLRVVATRLQQTLRETDTAFRMGGDEFVVIVENLDQSEHAAQAVKVDPMVKTETAWI